MMKKSISLLLIWTLVFCTAAVELQGAGKDDGAILLKKGMDFFNNAYFGKAIETLQKALEKGLNRDDSVRALLHTALASYALNKSGEAEQNFRKLIRIDPGFELGKEDYPADVLELFRKVREEFPVAYGLAVDNKEFYPYRGELPDFSFRLSAPDHVSMSLDSGTLEIFDSTENFPAGGNSFSWEWSDRLLETSFLNLELTPQRSGSEGSLKKRVPLTIQMPDTLIFHGSEFTISGEQFLPEYEKKAKKVFRQGAWASIIWGGLFALVGITALTSRKWTKEERPIGFASLGLGTVFIVWPFIFKKKTGKFRRVPIPSNKSHNDQLKREIESLKSEIKAKLDVGSEDSGSEK